MIIFSTVMIAALFFALRETVPGMLIGGISLLNKTKSQLFKTTKREFLKHANPNGIIDEQAAEIAAKDLLLGRHQADMQRLTMIEQRLHDLENLLKLKTTHFAEAVPTSIVSRSPSSWHTELIIDKGSKAGIMEGQVAITGRGLLGQIQSVKPDYAILQLLSGAQVRFGAVDGRSQILGIIYGTKPGKALLKFVPIGSDVKPGDPIFTTSLSQSPERLDRLFPAGYPVGRVTRVRKHKNNAELVIEVQLYEDGSKAQELLVLNTKSLKSNAQAQQVRIVNKSHKVEKQDSG
ncbi:MAG: rod shape-determining protein MreC [Candidatus Caenarcaniphilales bacterium]|nr:rod shape-determining protein MreC [Candidatus Caenarcaniphilales bacterium]